MALECRCATVLDELSPDALADALRSPDEVLGSTATASERLVVSVDGVKLNAKVYSGVEGFSLVGPVAASLRAVVRPLTFGSQGLGEAVERLLGAGLAPPLAYCFCHRVGDYARLYTIVSPLVEKEADLQDLLDRAEAGDAIGVDEARSILCRVAKAVWRLERAGLLHGDLRPLNILLRRGLGSPVVADMDGAVRIVDVERGYAPLFYTNYEDLDYAFPELPSLVYLDYMGLFWTGLHIASATSQDSAKGFKEGCCDEKFVEDWKGRLEEVLGRRFVEKYLEAWRGQFPKEGPVSVLWESLVSDGVCGE